MQLLYCGPKPHYDLQTSRRPLKAIPNLTGSQCRHFRTGVMCSDHVVLVKTKHFQITGNESMDGKQFFLIFSSHKMVLDFVFSF